MTDRLRSRFRETLDFAPLMSDYFVAGAARRNASAGSYRDFLDHFDVDPALVAGLDESELERGYVAFLNLAHLQDAYRLASHLDTIPPEVERESLASPYFRGLVEGTEKTNAPIDTVERYLRLIEDTEGICRVYRRVVSHDVDSSAAYTTSDVLTTLSDDDSGYPAFGIANGATVYEVRRDLWYGIVVDGGKLKVLTITSDE